MVLPLLIVYNVKKRIIRGFYFPVSKEKKSIILENISLEKRQLSCSSLSHPKNWKYHSFLFCKLDLTSGLQLEIGFPNLVICTVSAVSVKHCSEKKKNQRHTLMH